MFTRGANVTLGDRFSVRFLLIQVCKCIEGAETHVGLAAARSASIAAHLGRLHRLPQRDGVRLVLLIHLLSVVVLRLVMLQMTWEM